MNQNKPGILKMVRAPFLSSILSPLIAGSLLAVYITGKFEIINFAVVLVMGICLHIATNVYNDIYDTLQGTDKINVNRNEFSGGSGVLVDNPDLLPTMYRLARFGLLGAFVATIVLFFRVEYDLRFHLVALYLLSAFFSKYYTAAPVKLAYRGFGEVSVWFAFGPMAILVAAVSQNVGFHPVILVAMSITGISTLSILLIGQIIDVDADKATDKWGIAVRQGIKTTIYTYIFVQVYLCLNIMVLAYVMEKGWPVLIALLPYFLLLPKISNMLIHNEKDVESQKKAAGLNVSLHLLFSFLFVLSLGLRFLI